MLQDWGSELAQFNSLQRLNNHEDPSLILTYNMILHIRCTVLGPVDKNARLTVSVRAVRGALLRSGESDLPGEVLGE
jgi:hypothetical protein